MKRPFTGWRSSYERAALLALYAEVDDLLRAWECSCSQEPRCCRFGITGREPYPTAVELQEVRHAMRAANVTAVWTAAGNRRRLPLADRGDRPCPLLSAEGRCRIYASRPFGCRTFFCDQKVPRSAVSAIARRIGELSERFSPEDPGPRPLVRALAERRR
jgi:hypothetical protein